MQATSSWFSSAITDDDDEDENDEPVSPADTDWERDSSSLLERAKEALASSENYHTKTELKLPERLFLGDSTERDRIKEFSGEDVGNRTTPTSQSPDKNKEPKVARRAETLPTLPDALGRSKDAKLQRTASKSGSSGILGRLKRISRREKRASTMDEKIREGHFSLLPTPAEVMDVSESNDKLTSGPSGENSNADAKVKHSRRKSDLPIQDASRERTIEFGGVQRVHSIHSVQPSLVDDESIADRDSPPGSPLGSDEQWQEADLGESDLLDNIPTINEDMGITSTQEQKTSEKDDWHLTSIPGSFIVQQDDRQNQSPTHDLTALENLRIQERTNVESEEEVEGTTKEIPGITIESPAETDTAVHQYEKSEYAQALSRQTSDFDSSSSSDFLIATPAFTPSEGLTEEDDAATPRAVAEPDRSSYFDVPSVASPPSETTPNVYFAPLTHEDTWLDKVDLAHEERHYMIRHMVNQQIRWELDRLFLVKGMDELEHPSAANLIPKSDLAYLKSSPGQFTPDLPIIRILTKHVLSTLPLFSAATPIEGAAAMRTRLTNAKTFMDRGVLPLLHFYQSNSVSKAVDLNGEWQDELFDGPSTLNRMGCAIFKLTSRFITALADGKGHGFLWSKVPSPTEASFFAHRKPFNMLKQGGCEVNVVSSRLRNQTRECDFILSVRRYGFPASYVIRSESDFYNFAITLAQELGPQVRVRPVPAPDADLSIQPLMEDDESLLDERSASSSPTKEMLGIRRASIRINKVYKTNDGTSSSSSSLHNLSSPIASSLGGAPMSRDHVSHDSGVLSAESPVLSKKSPTIPQNQSTISLTSQHTKPTNSKRRSIDVQKSPINYSALVGSHRSGSRIFSASRPALKNNSTTDVSLLASLVPITADEESRRKQVRAWLRDTLSIRGAGHAKQTRAFLENDSFLERDLKPGSRADVQSRREVDEAEMESRKQMIEDSSKDVIELRQEMNQLWRECVEGNGFEHALSAVQQNTTFSALPLPYQRVISWTNLQVAQFLHHTFLDSHEARQNFDRFQEAVSCIPWKLLSLALRERTGWMLQQVQSCFLDEFVQKKILAIMLQDVPERKLDIEIEHLRERLGTTVMKKLEVFSKSSAWKKQIVRRAAQQADIPLVAAIMRGSDKPLLSAEGIKKVVSATKKYQEFIRSQPTYAEKKAKLKANVEVRRIYDMQYALRLLCQKRDGKNIREGLKAELKPIVSALLQPLFDLLKRLHKSKLLIHSASVKTSDSSASSIKSSKDEKRDVILDLQQFCLKLLDVLAGLRMRVQDPWRNLSTLTLLLDDAVPDWYRFLHASSLGDSLLYDFTQWLQSVASLLRFKETSESGGAADDILARFWAKPANDDGKSPLQEEGADRVALEAIVEHSWRKRTRQMEMASRWATGDADGTLDIQLMGEGGKTRMTAYEMKKQKFGPTIKVQSALDKFLPSFRAGLDRVLTADPGTAW
ncbi:hypothetical protein L7F22_038842 [Adiantum nelumboides]|nr:hypothetical protein [Adiantum nelumboides]